MCMDIPFLAGDAHITQSKQNVATDLRCAHSCAKKHNLVAVSPVTPNIYEAKLKSKNNIQIVLQSKFQLTHNR